MCREKTSWPAHQPHAPSSPHTPVKNLDLDFSLTDLSMYLSQLRSSHWLVGCNTCIYLVVWLNLVWMCFLMTAMSLSLSYFSLSSSGLAMSLRQPSLIRPVPLHLFHVQPADDLPLVVVVWENQRKINRLRLHSQNIKILTFILTNFLVQMLQYLFIWNLFCPQKVEKTTLKSSSEPLLFTCILLLR